MEIQYRYDGNQYQTLDTFADNHKLILVIDYINADYRKNPQYSVYFANAELTEKPTATGKSSSLQIALRNFIDLISERCITKYGCDKDGHGKINIIVPKLSQDIKFLSSKHVNPPGAE